ncbi:MAG: phosphotransferase family protein [Bacteroidota bacterium]
MSTAGKDTGEVRKGEEFSLEELNAFLSKYVPEVGKVREVNQFTGGFSNLTYQLISEKGKFVLRRPPKGANIQSAHDMGREYRILRLLEGTYPFIPKPVTACDDPEVIGAPFFIMEQVEGVILRNKLPEGMELGADFFAHLGQSTIEHLVGLHQVDLKAKPELTAFGKPDGYVDRQVSGWIKRYHKAKTDDITDMEELEEWLNEYQPREQAPAFLHNDYKFDNLVLTPELDGTIRAVLDWEMATVGDPLMDLGTTLSYWTEARDPNPAMQMFGLTHLAGNLHRQDVVAYYAEKSNRQVGEMLFYYVFATYKLAVIAQQIYARYKKGLTRDPRFGGLIHIVRASAQNGMMAIKFNRVGDFY